MGSLFRGEKMCLAQLFVQSEAAYSCVSELGELGLVQFRDLNPNVSAFQRKFVNEVRRCDEMERKIRYVEKEVKLAKVDIQENLSFIPAPLPRAMIDLEATCEKTEIELREVNQNNEVLARNYLELKEHQCVLDNAQKFFANVNIHQDAGQYPVLLEEEESGSLNRRTSVTLDFVAGVIERERVPAFEQMLWRVSRGNVFLRYTEIPFTFKEPSTGNDVFKFVFILFYQGSQLGMRVKRICEGFRASQYPCPEDFSERQEMVQGIAVRLQDLELVLSQMDDHRQRLLKSAALNLSSWYIKVRKLKAIYHTMNMFNFDVTSRCLIGECWCPVDELGTIRLALQRATQKSGSSVPSILNRISTTADPPTYNKTNSFTQGFQNLTDAYGVASYREVNPAPFTIITFPFLFGVMFGDAGHGFILALFGLWMLIRERRLKYTMGASDMFSPIYSGRYLIFLMGLFSIYCGFMYNDCFSKSFNIFGSAWNSSEPNCLPDYNPEIDSSHMLDPKYCFSGDPYPFGLDPIWQLSSNSLNFVNSLKMRLSVVFGITQMTFGVLLGCINHVLSGKYHSVVLEFIPQIIFMVSIFGYLIFLIFFKWFAYGPWNSETAPSLINVLIYMFQLQVPEPQMYHHQRTVQIVLVVVAVLCVPWMLFGTPIYLYAKHRFSMRHRKDGYMPLPTTDCVNVNGADVEIMRSMGNEDNDRPSTSSGSHSLTDDVFESSQQVEDEFDMGEIFTLQAIHTIEYCLGCVSNTASYLRLWALSLAHAELSDVLWTMVMKNGWIVNSFFADATGAMYYVAIVAGGIDLFYVFIFWAILTVAVLLMMEGLSAFLHTLRLHWIEFQNKFYKGEGYAFVPFSLAHVDIEDH